MIKIHLSKLLGEKKMSQAELSRRTGIRHNTICDIYNEICISIKIEHLELICEVLDCNVGDLIKYQKSTEGKRRKRKL